MLYLNAAVYVDWLQWFEVAVHMRAHRPQLTPSGCNAHLSRPRVRMQAETKLRVGRMKRSNMSLHLFFFNSSSDLGCSSQLPGWILSHLSCAMTGRQFPSQTSTRRISFHVKIYYRPKRRRRRPCGLQSPTQPSPVT